MSALLLQLLWGTMSPIPEEYGTHATPVVSGGGPSIGVLIFNIRIPIV